MVPTTYKPLPFGTYYYQELKKDYELWPSYNSSSNPHKRAVPICPFWCWMMQWCYFISLYNNPLHNNPGNESDGVMTGEPVIYGLPQIPGLPKIPGVLQLPYIVQ